MSRIVFSIAARRDRQEITKRTIRDFGHAQAIRTKEAFRKTLTTLAEMPLMGHQREDLSPAGRAFLYHTVLTRFWIVYEPMDGGIRVARLLHSSRDILSEIKRDAGKEE